MFNLREELKNGTSLVAIAIGMLLGASIIATIGTIQLRKLGFTNGLQRNENNSNIQNNATGQIDIKTVPVKIGNQVVQVAPSYAEGLKNPGKPFTDERGVVHPPLGGTGTTAASIDQSKVQRPPLGGSAPTTAQKTSAAAKASALTPAAPVVTPPPAN